jgi:hypothetical protein
MSKSLPIGTEVKVSTNHNRKIGEEIEIGDSKTQESINIGKVVKLILAGSSVIAVIAQIVR